MNRETTEKTTGDIRNDKKGDGRSVATLLGLSAVLLVVSVCTTNRYLKPADRLSDFVPADVPVYLHMNRTAEPAPGFMHAPYPAELDPDEVALIGLQPDEDDSGLQWATLLGWRRPPEPGSDKTKLLLDAGAVMLNERTFVIAGDEAIDRIHEATLSGITVSENRSMRRSLATVRDLAPIQLYLDPRGVPASSLPPSYETFRLADPFVAALSQNRPAEFSMILIPTDTAASVSRLTGFALSPDTIKNTESYPTLPTENTVVRSADSLFDPIPVFFGDIEVTSRHIGIPHDAYIDKAKQDLRDILSGPKTVTLFANDKLNSRKDKANSMAEMSGLELSTVVSAIEDYIAAAIPMRRTLTLPDNDAIQEYVVNPESVRISTLTEEGYAEVRLIEEVRSGFSLVVAVPNDSDSIFIASDAAILLTGTGHHRPETRNHASPCSYTGGRDQLQIADAESWSKDLPWLNSYLMDRAVDRLTLKRTGDKTIVICGYLSSDVDKK